MTTRRLKRFLPIGERIAFNEDVKKLIIASPAFSNPITTTLWQSLKSDLIAKVVSLFALNTDPNVDDVASLLFEYIGTFFYQWLLMDTHKKAAEELKAVYEDEKLQGLERFLSHNWQFVDNTMLPYVRLKSFVLTNDLIKFLVRNHGVDVTGLAMFISTKFEAHYGVAVEARSFETLAEKLLANRQDYLDRNAGNIDVYVDVDMTMEETIGGGRLQ